MILPFSSSSRMKFSAYRFLAPLLFATAPIYAESSPYRGLWVGEVFLGAVNETTTGLDENNIPRAPDPNVTTPTSDIANLRLILHVDATGRTTLLKHVAVLARKAGLQESENDLALVTDERLYGAFPPQAATRISSVAFDYGDAKATAAVDQLVEAIATEAARAAQVGSPTAAAVSAAAEVKGLEVVSQAGATAAYTALLQNDLNKASITAIAQGGDDATARAAALALKNASFFGDNRGVEMLDAIAALPAGGDRVQAALNIAAAFAETDLGYDRFLAGELFGDMIRDAAGAAATSAVAEPLSAVNSFVASVSGPLVTVNATEHGIEPNAEIAIQGAAVGSYNGLHKVTLIDDDSFQIQVDFVTGGAITGFAAQTGVAPVTVSSSGHGLATNDFVTLRGAPNGYNGRHLVTVIDSDQFAINVPFSTDPEDRGVWFSRSGEIVSFEGTDDNGVGVKIVAPGHGLNNGQQISISGSGESSYNGLRTVTRLNADAFSVNLAFAGNPIVKGSWDLPIGISGYSGPTAVPSVVNAPAHGLSSGDRIVISGSGNSSYNGEFTISVIDADHFSVPVDFDSATGDPGVKGSWLPAGGGQWRNVASVRAAVNDLDIVNDASVQAINVGVSAFDDSRAPDAVTGVIDAIILAATTSGSSLVTQVEGLAADAAREALSTDVLRYPRPSTVPSSDYDEFVASTGYTGAAKLAADAAAASALEEKAELLATPSSIKDKAKQGAINALTTVYAAASRSLLTELPMGGDFGPQGSGLSTKITLPANHPTNPFRHRRHPDNGVGFDIEREINLAFDAADQQPLGRANYGVDRITGIYDEEIFGLHKPLGPLQDIGLKVHGTFQLNRISLIDTLNGR